MKVHIEIEMTPEEARKAMGLPDIAPLHEELLAETRARLRAAMDASDPQSLLKAWLPASAPGIEQFQKLFWETARKAAGVKGD